MTIHLTFDETHFRRAPQRGVTLIEMMVVVTIMAVLTALAAPSFVQTMQRYRVQTALDELGAAMSLARVEGIKRGGRVSLSRTTGCTLAGSDDWSCGWQVMADDDTDCVVDAGDVVIQTFAAPANTNVVRSANGTCIAVNRWGQLGGVNAVGFVASPKPDGVSSPETTTLCMASGGRIRRQTGSVVC